MNVCCMGVCGYLPNNAIPRIIAVLYSSFVLYYALQYLFQYVYML